MAEKCPGQVFDLGYRRYDGLREGRRRSRLSLFKNGVRSALGLGRGGRAKIVPWLFIAAAMIPALVFALVAGAVDRVAPDFDEALDLPSHADYYGVAGVILLLFAAIVGPELVCPDRRNGLISLYLVRPITRLDYGAARWLALLVVVLLLAYLPQLVLLAGLALGASSPGEYLADHWLDIPRFLAAGAALAVYVTTLALLAASYTTRRSYAAAFLVGLFLISAAVVGAVTDNVDPDVGRWIALLSVSDVPILVNDQIFDSSSTLAAEEASRLPGGIQVGWYLLVLAATGGLLAQRFRRLEA